MAKSDMDFFHCEWIGSLGEACKDVVSCTKHSWYSEHGMYYQFKIILERVMSVTHVAVIPHTRTHSDEEEFLKK